MTLIRLYISFLFFLLVELLQDVERERHIQFLFDNYDSRPNNSIRRVIDYYDAVVPAMPLLLLPVKAFAEALFANIAHPGQILQTLEKSATEIIPRKRTHCIPRRIFSLDFRRDHSGRIKKKIQGRRHRNQSKDRRFYLQVTDCYTAVKVFACLSK